MQNETKGGHIKEPFPYFRVEEQSTGHGVVGSEDQ